MQNDNYKFLSFQLTRSGHCVVFLSRVDTYAKCYSVVECMMCSNIRICSVDVMALDVLINNKIIQITQYRTTSMLLINM